MYFYYYCYYYYYSFLSSQSHQYFQAMENLNFEQKSGTLWFGQTVVFFNRFISHILSLITNK